MKRLDRLLQRRRIRQAVRFLPAGCRVIDVGAHEGELFRALGLQLVRGFGIDPVGEELLTEPTFVVAPGAFPSVRPEERGWDAVTMLAVLEHIPAAGQAEVATACHELLRPGGRVIVTVPSQAADHILVVLRFLRLIDGISLEEHYGFAPRDTERVFAPPGFDLVHRSRFQFGLNHLYVFERR